MASDDVIELGSSDDDTEPPPKKKKPILNAMVHIPSKLPGLTIKPAKTAPSTNKAPSLATIKPTKTAPSTNKAPLLAKPIIVKTNLKVNPLHIAKPSTTAVRVPIQNKIPIRNDAKIIKSPNKAITIKPISSIRNDAKITKNSNKAITINPISNIAQNLSKTQVILTKVPLKRPKSTTEIKQPNVLTGLSPSITIKPVKSAGATFRPVHIASGSSTIKKRRIGPKRKQQGEVMTVDLDDDDESATASPQWYLRPGEQSHKETPKNNSKEPEGKKKDESSMEVDSIEPSMEEKNNKEPDTTKYVEITIEDSPLKPIHRHPDIGKELPITIEDSPVKPITKATNNVESDCETNEVTGDKNSKKKLNYPKESKNCQQNNVVEIEIDFQDSSVAVAETSPKNKLNETKKSPKNKSNDSEKPLENTSTESEKPDKQSESEKVNHSKTINNVEKTKEIVIDDKEIVIDDKEIVIEDDEFHPTYQKFINLCFQLENSEDMKKIVEKKIKSYYRQCPKDYVESEEFLDMVASKIVSMEASPAKMYLYIKDIVDELNLQRKMQKSVISEEAEKEKEANMKYYEESLSKYDSKKQRQIRKLEKTIKKLHRAIQKLEEQEVDFDDDEDSVYLLTERYKERMVRVHAKFCQLTNTKMPSEPRIHIEARPGRPAGPARKLEKWINRKVPIGTPLPFPDFHDVLRCVRAANEEDKLGWNDVDIMEEARDLFTRCGKKLQRRRQENEWRIAASRISAEADPAEISMELKKKLDENKTVAAKRETELLNKYVDRQNLLKLEAVEIGDKEAEESPLESEEEEEDVGETDNALDNKEKRKQRLKRLIEEKNKRGEEKDNAENKDSEKKNDKTECKDEISKGNVQDKANAEISEENPDNVEVKSLPSETGIEARNEDKEDSGTLKENKIENKKENSNNEGENKNNENKDSESNDSDYKVECDIDELHLLQKLHSENEANSSTADSSDSDSPIPISDSLDSYSDVENGGKMCDVISIENSSYSESEMIIDGSSKDGSDSFKKHKVEELVSANFEIEYSSTGIDESNKETAGAEAAVEMVEENILLASSDDEGKDNVNNVSIESTCINLRDDNISITETTVDGVAFEGENLSNDDNSLPENNNPVDATEESSGVENNHVSLITTQEIIEDSDRLSEKPTQLCPNVDIEMSDNNGSPKEDVVDIRSASDVNSVESTDMQADIGNQEDISDAPESMDISEPTCSEQGELTQTVTV